MKTAYKCAVCDATFGNKREWTKHAKRCESMEVEKEAQKPPRRRRIPAAVRFALWNATFGEHKGAGTCFCCGRSISQQTFEAGHVVAVARGGADSLDNLRPICGPCNKSMGSTNMMEFIDRHKAKNAPHKNS